MVADNTIHVVVLYCISLQLVSHSFSLNFLQSMFVTTSMRKLMKKMMAYSV